MAKMRHDRNFISWMLTRNRKRRMEAISDPGSYTPPDVTGFDTTSIYKANGVPNGYEDSILGERYEVTIKADNLDTILADIAVGLLRVVWTSSDTDVAIVGPKPGSVGVGAIETVAVGSSTIAASLQRTDTDEELATNSSHMEVINP